MRRNPASPRKRPAKHAPRTAPPKRPALTPEAREQANAAALANLPPRCKKLVQCSYGNILVEELLHSQTPIITAVSHQLLMDAPDGELREHTAAIIQELTDGAPMPTARDTLLQRLADHLALSVELYDQEVVATFHPPTIFRPGVARLFFFRGKYYGVRALWSADPPPVRAVHQQQAAEQGGGLQRRPPDDRLATNERHQGDARLRAARPRRKGPLQVATWNVRTLYAARRLQSPGGGAPGV